MGYNVVGVEHKSCPIQVRERLAVTSPLGVEITACVVAGTEAREAVLLAPVPEPRFIHGARNLTTRQLSWQVSKHFSDFDQGATPYIAHLDGQVAVEHAFRVVAGLESQIVGEYEIAGQARAAVRLARIHGTLGPHLEALFSSATMVSRRLKSETSLGQVDMSVAASARSLLEAQSSLPDSAVLVIGSGRIARLLCAELSNVGRLAISSRTKPAAEAIGSALGITVLPLEDALSNLAQFDVVITATRSTTPVILAQHVRGTKGLIILDLAVPRNVDAAVEGMEGIRLYDVDAVRPADNAAADAGLIESIIDAEVHDFLGRETLHEVGAIIEALRQHVDLVREEELQRMEGRLQHMSPGDRAAVESVTLRLIDRMFHHLVVRLRLAALSDPELLRAAEFFFAHGDNSIFPARVSTPVVDESLETVAER